MLGKMIMEFLHWLQQQNLKQGALAEGGQPVEEIPTENAGEKGAADSDGASPTPAIAAHHLYEVDFYPTNNHGGKITPRYLIMHFTANGSVAGTVKWFQKQGSEASAHIIIGRDGRVVQMIPFNLRAWHCGKSRWAGMGDLNSHSIGIEMVNWGKLTYRKGKLVSWAQEVIAEDDAILAADKDGKQDWWQRYTLEQIEVCANLAREIVRAYGLEDVLGHHEIAIPDGRKSDPGPAFPLEQVREFCFSDAGDWRDFVTKNKDGK